MKRASEVVRRRDANVKRLEKEAPALVRGFAELARGCNEPGVVETRYKELAAVAAAIATRCEPCLAFHLNKALEAGATRQELIEIAGIGVEFGGGPSFVMVRDNLQEFLDDLEDGR
jgi:AhpD family alkylhydroperoxidase